MMRLLQTSNSRRTTESTKANDASSRSHAILQLTIYKKPRGAGYEYEQKVGKLNMIDLAGSERGSVTENRGIRLFEGAKINRSLLALANCINALGDKSRKGTFVPYRDSKLTRLLKDSLGGRSRTLMLCAIAPGSLMFEETLNTLKYANRAKEIKVQVEENKKVVELHIAEYKGIIEDLRKEIDDLNRKGRASSIPTKDIKGCAYCTVSADIEVQIENLKDLLEEQTQLRKQVVEIKAQNKQNLVDMDLMRANGDPKDSQEDIASLEKSVDFNTNYKSGIEDRIKDLSSQINGLLNHIDKNLPSDDARRMVSEVVQMKATEIENMEYELNLKVYEQENKALIEEVRFLQRALLDAGIEPEEDGLDRVQEDDEDLLDIEETNREVNELKKKMQESGIEFEEYDPAGEQDLQIEDEESEYKNLRESNSVILCDDHSEEGVLDNGDVSHRKVDSDEEEAGEKEKERIVSHKDMENEMNLLNTIDRSKLNFDNQPADPNYQRFSTIRGEKKRDRIVWNSTIGWGEEFRVYEGEYYPETTGCFEAEITITERDFEEILDEKELKLLRDIELGDEY